ncbi:MAG: acetoacetate decarboxylase family protein [Gammaproteobacteria bacterium]|jgi:acetoacetate decarboxylase
MGFVRTKEEIARIQEALSRPRFVNSQMLSVDFITHQSTIDRLLPPGLQSTGNPRVTAMVGRWQSNCVGDFDGGAIYLEARHEDIVGDYVLAMYMDRDQPIIYGRELFGEPKKQSTSRLFRNGEHFNARIERYGATLIELDVDIIADHGPSEGEGINFNYKAIPATNGIGLEWDAALTVARFHTVLKVTAEGYGRVQLGHSVHDPLNEIEIVEVLRGAYVEGDLIARAETLAYINGQDFLPYALGRTDDWSALDTETRPAVAAPQSAMRQAS